MSFFIHALFILTTSVSTNAPASTNAPVAPKIEAPATEPSVAEELIAVTGQLNKLKEELAKKLKVQPNDLFEVGKSIEQMKVAQSILVQKWFFIDQESESQARQSFAETYAAMKTSATVHLAEHIGKTAPDALVTTLIDLQIAALENMSALKTLEHASLPAAIVLATDSIKAQAAALELLLSLAIYSKDYFEPTLAALTTLKDEATKLEVTAAATAATQLINEVNARQKRADEQIKKKTTEPAQGAPQNGPQLLRPNYNKEILRADVPSKRKLKLFKSLT